MSSFNAVKLLNWRMREVVIAWSFLKNVYRGVHALEAALNTSMPTVQPANPGYRWNDGKLEALAYGYGERRVWNAIDVLQSLEHGRVRLVECRLPKGCKNPSQMEFRLSKKFRDFVLDEWDGYRWKSSAPVLHKGCRC